MTEFMQQLYDRLHLSLRRKTPQYLQTEAAECGLACLAMVGNYHGLDADLLSLRQRFGISARGATLGHLIDIASALSLKTRALSLDVDEIGSLRLPCILHWDMNHFVVLTAVRGSSLVIHDPAFGRRVLGMQEFCRHFTGIALELWPANEFKPVSWRNRLKLRTLLSNISGLPAALGKIFCYSLVIEAINLLLPVGTQLVMDHAIPASDRNLLAVICLGLLVFVLFRTGIMLLRTYSSLVMNALIDVQWKNGLFDHLMKLPLAYFEKRQLGDIQARFGSLDTLRETFTSNVVNGIIDLIMSVGVLIMMLFYGGALVWAVLGFTSLYVALRLLTYRSYRQASEEHVVKEAKAGSHLMETLYGIGTLKALGLADTRSRFWLNLNIDATNTQIRIAKLEMIFTGINALIMACDQIVILWLGAALVIDNQMTLGMFVAFNAYRGQFSERAGNLIAVILQLRMLSLHNERIADIVLSPTELAQPPHSLCPLNQAASFEVRDLYYQYDSLTKPLIDGLNLQIAPGESVAIVGPSGAGKTTLMKLMAGLLTPTSGTLLFNGLDIHAVGLSNYRRHVACVLQDDKLFSGSIAENITSFEPQPDEERMIACCRHCNIDEDIRQMPMGYQTLIGELGGGLSGGQKQRLFIARALYRQPSILFMDEATSHLDQDNEAHINAAIASLKITRIIIAHRLSTIASADRVINLKPGY